MPFELAIGAAQPIGHARRCHGELLDGFGQCRIADESN